MSNLARSYKYFILAAAALFIYADLSVAQTIEAVLASTSEPVNASSVSGYILFIIPQYNFVDDEYSIPKVIISRAGYTVETASISSKELALGSDIIKVRPNLTIEQIDPAKYKGVIFVGGYLSKKFFDNKALIAKAQEFSSRGTLIGAMDNTPYFMAQWGLLKDVKVTVTPSLAKAMKNMGINYSDKNIVLDKNFITVDSYRFSDAFAGEFLAELKKR